MLGWLEMLAWFWNRHIRKIQIDGSVEGGFSIVMDTEKLIPRQILYATGGGLHPTMKERNSSRFHSVSFNMNMCPIKKIKCGLDFIPIEEIG